MANKPMEGGTRAHFGGRIPWLVSKSKSKLQTRLDATAFVLLASGIVVTISILGYSPGQDPSQHLLGSIGSWLVRLFESLGLMVYLLAFGWFVLAITLFFVQRMRGWLIRLAGWLVLLPSSTAIAEQLGRVQGDAVAGDGGTLGAAVERNG